MKLLHAPKIETTRLATGMPTKFAITAMSEISAFAVTS